MKELSRRQLEIMSILWNSSKPLIASEIVGIKDDLNINTVQSVLRSLIKKKYIDIAEIVYSGKVLTRSYKALVTEKEYLREVSDGMKKTLSQNEILASFVDSIEDNETIERLQTLIQERKEKLER